MHSVKPLTVYSVADSAVDLIEMGVGGPKYLTNRDVALVKFVDDKKPTEFTVKRIDSAAYAAFIECESSIADQRRAAFMLCVTGIRNIRCQKTGALISHLVPSDRRTVRGIPIPAMSEEDLDRIAPAYVREIGEVARMRSDLPLGSADSYHPPVSLLRVFEARLTSRAAELLASLHSREASQKSKASRAKAKKAKRGGKATAATATAKATKQRARAAKRRKGSSK